MCAPEPGFAIATTAAEERAAFRALKKEARAGRPQEPRPEPVTWERRRQTQGKGGRGWVGRMSFVSFGELSGSATFASLRDASSPS